MAPAIHKTLILETPGAISSDFRDLIQERLMATSAIFHDLSNHLSVSAAELRDPSGDFLVASVPAGLASLGKMHRSMAVLRSPDSTLRHWKSGHAPGFVTDAYACGMSIELFRLLFSPGFDTIRLQADYQFGIHSSPLLYVDACSLESCLATLDDFDLVLVGDQPSRLQAMHVLMQWHLQPPLSAIDLPEVMAGAEPDTDGQFQISDFDRDFYREASRRHALNALTIERDFDQYIANYPLTHGYDLGRLDTEDISLMRPIGSHWFPAEAAEDSHHFRWSTAEAPSIELPLAREGWYSLRIYVFHHETPDIQATMACRGGIDSHPMSVLRHGDLVVLDGHVNIPGPGWLQVQFAHGSIPVRPGSDLRLRGFVLGRILLRRLR